MTKSEKQLLDHNRVYYKLLRKLAVAGQASGELTKAMSAGDIVRYYAFCERALIYDWCLVGGEYALTERAAQMMPFFLKRIENNE